MLKAGGVECRGTEPSVYRDNDLASGFEGEFNASSNPVKPIQMISMFIPGAGGYQAAFGRLRHISRRELTQFRSFLEVLSDFEPRSTTFILCQTECARCRYF